MNTKGLIDIKRAVTPSKEAKKITYFVEYKNGEMWYKTEWNEMFPVPMSDVGNTTFKAIEPAMLLMRYMRKWNELLK